VAALGTQDRLRRGSENRCSHADGQLAHCGRTGCRRRRHGLVDLNGQDRHQRPQLVGVQWRDQVGDLVVLPAAGGVKDEARQLAATLVEVHGATYRPAGMDTGL
jgi:hypothetical protein